MDETRSLNEEALDQNYDAFKKLRAQLLPEHAGRCTLMRNRSLVGIYNSISDVIAAGRSRFPHHLWSVQPVDDEPEYFVSIFDA